MIGRSFGRYRVVSLLAAGGMGEVYRARDTQLDRDVALKVVLGALADDPEAVRRFEREAKAIAALSHPNILAIHDFGSERGLRFAVMELLEGETLRALEQRGRVGWRRAIEITIAIGEGLAAAHAQGIVHRDLKPENVFVTREGRVKILDFGIARVNPPVAAPGESRGAGSEEQTRTGVVMGTIGYMSPEQVCGEKADARSDLFSLGCVLHELLTGEAPFARPSQAESIAAVLNDEPAGLELAEAGLPAEAARVVRHCLEKGPAERFQSARDLVFDLKALLGGEPLPVRPARRPKPSRRWPWIAAAALLVVAVAAATALLWLPRRTGAIDSLAVLPLANASGDPGMEYLSDGITENLIDNLSQLPALRVMARSTVFSLKGQHVDPRDVGRRLNVRAVLSGRVVVHGPLLTIHAELVNVADGSQLWGHKYEQALANVLDLQADIARQIADQLRVALTGPQRERLAKRYTQNPEAHLLYTRGRHQFANTWTADGFRRGVGLLQQAIALDPTYALPHAGLATTYYEASCVVLPPATAMPLVKASALKALQLDESLAEAHTALALELAYYEWKWDEARRHLQRAIALNPSYAEAHLYNGVLLYETGSGLPAAMREVEAAVQLDPLTPSTGFWSGFLYLLERRYDEAAKEMLELTQTHPDFPLAHDILGNVYEAQGRFPEAIAQYLRGRELDPQQPYLLGYLGHAYGMSGERAKALDLLREMEAAAKGSRYVDPAARAYLLIGLGDKSGALDALEEALDQRSENFFHNRDLPAFDPLRTEPRFRDMLRRTNLER